jgi:hypothetical protein
MHVKDVFDEIALRCDGHRLEDVYRAVFEKFVSLHTFMLSTPYRSYVTQYVDDVESLIDNINTKFYNMLASVPEHVPVSSPKPEPAPAPVSEPVPEPAPEPVSVPHRPKNLRKWVVRQVLKHTPSGRHMTVTQQRRVARSFRY